MISLKTLRTASIIATTSLGASAAAGVVPAGEIVGEIDFSKLTVLKDVKNPREVAKNLGLISSNWTTGFTTGAASGQNGWTHLGGNTGNYQITATRPGGAAGQGLAITKSNTNTRYLYKDASAAFAARAATETQVWADFDIYYGGTSAVGNSARGSSMDGNGANMTAGAGVDLGTLSTTHVSGRLRGYAYLTAAAAGGTAGNYVFNLGVTLTSAQWVKFSTVKDLSTGRVSWFYSLDGGTNWNGSYFDAGVRSISTMEFDYIMTNTGVSTSQTGNFGDMALYTVPGPGAIALVGVAGMVASTRRRK